MISAGAAAAQSYSQPAPNGSPQSTSQPSHQPSPQASPIPHLAALTEQEPSPDGLLPRTKSAEPKAADGLALQTTLASQASGSFGGDIVCSGSGHNGDDDKSCGGDSDGYCSGGSSVGGTSSDHLVSSVSGGTGGSSCEGGSFSGGDSSGGGSSVGGGSDGDGSHGGSHVDQGAAAENAPVAPADLGHSSGAGSPAGRSQNGIAEETCDCTGGGSGGAPAETGAGNTANLTAQKLTTGEVSFLDVSSQLSTASQSQRTGHEKRGRGAGGGMQAADQYVFRGVNPSAKEEADAFLADLKCECALQPTLILLSAFQPDNCQSACSLMQADHHYQHLKHLGPG